MSLFYVFDHVFVVLVFLLVFFLSFSPSLFFSVDLKVFKRISKDFCPMHLKKFPNMDPARRCDELW